MEPTMQSCATCLFWASDIAKKTGNCRRHSPNLSSVDAKSPVWPLTLASDGCGDGAPAKPKAA